MARRVVITGLGTVTGFGAGIAPLWEGLCAGRSAVGEIGSFDASGFPSRFGVEVKDFRARDCVPKGYRKATKVMARDSELAVGAAAGAVEDAGLVTRMHEDADPTYPPARVGCHIGAGLIAAETDELTLAFASARDESGTFDLGLWGERGIGDLQPLWMLKYLPNMLACHVSIVHGAEGPSNTVTCCEASGLLSIGESARVIERGGADACFAGGAESKLNVIGLCRLGLAGRLAQTDADTDPNSIVRPFDPYAPGSVVGEGGGILILEEQASAAARGATVYAEIKGFGAAHSAPSFEGPAQGLDGADAGRGLAAAIRRAIDDAGATPEEIDAIVPFGAGSRAPDAAEASAFRAVFGDRASSIPLVTWTPALGDCQAGNGGIQASIGAMCVREQRLPARINAGSPDLDAGAGPAKDARIGLVLVCSPSLGGQNAALVLGAPTT